MTKQAPADRDALRERYRRERDKRIRPEGADQYIQPTGRFAHLLDDPYAAKTPRAPVTDEVTVALIGGGFSGIVTGARLAQAGIRDVRLIEGGGDVGGAWYWNRYPGAMCDTAAMIYLPLLEETGHRPSRKYVLAPEIFGQAQRIAKQFDLYDKALFSTQVTRLEWHEPSKRWIVHTDRGDAIRARFVAMGTGPLHRPKLPGIAGIESFEGHAFHTSRWDYAYTGGDANGAPLDRLGNKRVGIVGTGATSVQCIPPLARAAKALYVFQRTPSSIGARDNHDIDPQWFATLEPGWQRKWQENFAIVQMGGIAEQDYVNDGWTDISRRIRDRVIQALRQPGATFSPELIKNAYEESDDEKMTEIRARVESIVQDRATAERLKPWYGQLCKRPCFHDEYLQTYNFPNTHLVDTDGRGVERIDATGAWVSGKHYDLDCLIFASGFEVGTEHAGRPGFPTFGRDGVSLAERWAEGMQSLHGIHVRGFPNLFIVGIGQAGNLVSNVTHNLVEAGTTIAAVIAHAVARGATRVETSEAAERAWVTLLESNQRSIFGNPECTPGYYNNEGKPFGRRDRLNTAGYPMGPAAYFEHIDAWRSSGAFEGLEIE